MTAARPSRASSPSRLSSFSFSRPSWRAYWLSVRVSAAAEALEVRSALRRVDVVGEGEHGLDVRAVPLQRDLEVALLALALEVDDVLVHRVLGLVDVRDEVSDPALVVELLGLPAGALVREDDAKAAGEEGGLAQALQQRRRVELGLLENLGVGKERDRRPRLVLARDADRLHLRRRLAARELLAVDLLVAANLHDEPLGEGVDDGHADAVQPAGDLVAVAAELPAGMQLGENDRERRQALLRDDVDRDPRARVSDRHRVVGMNGHRRRDRSGPRGPRRRRCRPPRRRGDGGLAGPSTRCTSRVAVGPARGLRGQ